MIASDIQPGRSYVDRHGNIYRVREISAGRAYFNIEGIHLLPLASSELDSFAREMVMEVHAKGQRGT